MLQQICCLFLSLFISCIFLIELERLCQRCQITQVMQASLSLSLCNHCTVLLGTFNNVVLYGKHQQSCIISAEVYFYMSWHGILFFPLSTPKNAQPDKSISTAIWDFGTGCTQTHPPIYPHSVRLTPAPLRPYHDCKWRGGEGGRNFFKLNKELPVKRNPPTLTLVGVPPPSSDQCVCVCVCAQPAPPSLLPTSQIRLTHDSLSL